MRFDINRISDIQNKGLTPTVNADRTSQAMSQSGALSGRFDNRAILYYPVPLLNLESTTLKDSI